MTPVHTSLVIPQMPSLKRASHATIRVDLPLSANIRRWICVTSILFDVLLCVSLIAICISAVFFVHYTVFAFVVLVICGIYTFYCVRFVGSEFSQKLASLQSSVPILSVDGVGIRDSRTGLNVAWSDVASARVMGVRQEWSGVALRLRDQGLASNSRVRRPPKWARLHTDEIHVRTKWLSVPNLTLVNCIVTLVKLSGGELVPVETSVNIVEEPHTIPQ